MSLNPQTVEETKAQIRGLVNEIAALAKAGAPAEEFYPELLTRVITALAAAGGAIWLLDDDRQLKLQYQINAEPSILASDTDDAIRHSRLIQRVANAGQSLLVPPYSRTNDGDAEGNPTRYLLVIGSLAHDGQKDGLIEVFQRPDTAPETQRGYLRFLEQMCGLAAEWLRSQKLRDYGDRQVLWQQADSFARAAHESLDLKQTAHIVANEGRRLIGCDRVSIAIKKGRKCNVQAISGQYTIENRSNIVLALNNLATRVVAAGEPLLFDGTTEDLPPQIEEALEDYVDQSHGRNIAVLPLRGPQRKLWAEVESGAVGEIDRDDARRGEVIGALIVEQIETDIPKDLFLARCDLVYEHGARALTNSLEHMKYRSWFRTLAVGLTSSFVEFFRSRNRVEPANKAEATTEQVIDLASEYFRITDSDSDSKLEPWIKQHSDAIAELTRNVSNLERFIRSERAATNSGNVGPLSESDLVELRGKLANDPVAAAKLQSVLVDICPVPVTLESFDGYVEDVVDDLALVTLISEAGERLSGEYPAAELARHKIGENQRFRLETIQTGESVAVAFRPLPNKTLLAEEEEAIYKDIDEICSDEGTDTIE